MIYRVKSIIAALLVAFPLAACTSSDDQLSLSYAIEHAGGKYVSDDFIAGLKDVEGHTVYVPVYSHIYHRDGDNFHLTSTLSIRNTDAKNPIYLVSVQYYNTMGKLVRKVNQSPMALPPMSTLEHVVGVSDREGGSGANFLIEWVADPNVSKPLIECVMIGTASQQGISFVTRGVNIN